MTSVLRLHIFLSLLLLGLSPLAEAFRLCKENKAGNLGLGRSGANLNEFKQGSMSPTALNAAKRFKNFEQLLDSFREEPVIIYFTTAKCGPCRLMAKELKTVQNIVGDEMKIFSLDTEKWPQVGSRFKVNRLPCLVFFREGEITLRMEGVNPAETVVEQVRAHLLQSRTTT
jgi:thioredoxin-like negative regulator of GroEL